MNTRNSRIAIGTIIILLLACAVLGFMLFRDKSTDTLQDVSQAKQSVNIQDPKAVISAWHDYKNSYPGTTEAAAIAKAKADGLTPRIVARDDEQFAVTDDLRFDRINLYIMDGSVTRVEFY